MIWVDIVKTSYDNLIMNLKGASTLWLTTLRITVLCIEYGNAE